MMGGGALEQLCSICIVVDPHALGEQSDVGWQLTLSATSTHG